VEGQILKNAAISLYVATTLLAIIVFSQHAVADAAYTKNKKANKLYSQQKYQEALTLYDEALLASPKDKRLAINKGSAQFMLGKFDSAQMSYDEAQSVKEPNAKTTLLYNLGNAFLAQAQQGGQGNPEQAKELLEKAKKNYIKALDVDPSDEDSKWNLEIVQYLLKQNEEQQKNQQQNKDQKNQDNKNGQQQQQDQQNKDQQNQNKDQQQQDQQNKDQQKQDQQKQNEQQKQDQKDQQKKDEQQQPKPDENKKPEQRPMTPAEMQQKKEEEAKKQDAVRLLLQYSDDAKELNKPPKQKIAAENRPEKDW
jgi:Ca-activated chloride channel family protein